MKLKKEDVLLKFFSISRPTYYKWKREKRPVALFIEKYFSINEINDFIQKNEVKRLEKKLEDDKSKTILNIIYNQYFNFYSKLDFYYISIYFSLLNYCNDKYQEYDDEIDKKTLIKTISYDFYKDNSICIIDLDSLIHELDRLDKLVIDYIVDCFNSNFKHLAIKDTSYYYTGNLKMDDDIIFLHHQVYFKFCKKRFPIENGNVYNIIANIFNKINELDIDKLIDLYKNELNNLIYKIENNDITLDIFNKNDNSSFISFLEDKINFLINNQSDVIIFYNSDFLYIDYNTFNELVLIPHKEELFNINKYKLLLIYLESL